MRRNANRCEITLILVNKKEDDGQDYTYGSEHCTSSCDTVLSLDDEQPGNGDQYQCHAEDITEPFPPLTRVIIQEIELVE